MHDDLIHELMLDERAENDMMFLYKTLLESGAVDCLPREERQQFKEKLQTLFTESEKHLKIMFDLTEKYRRMES